MKQCNYLKHAVIFQQLGRHISGKVLREIITEIDTNNNGQVELDEYLQVRTKYKNDFFGNKMGDVLDRNT